MNEDERLVRAVGEVALQTSIPVQTTLTADYIPATDYIDVADASRLSVNGVLSWWDGSGERDQIIQTISGSRVHVRLRTGDTGLLHAHATGAVVATNLVCGAPRRIGPMLGKGQTVLLIYFQRGARRKFGGKMSDRTVVVRIQLHRTLNSEDDDPTLFSLDQQAALHDDSQTLQFAIEDRQKLQDRSGNAQVRALGERESSAPYMTEVWEPLVTDLDIPQAIGAFDLTIQPGEHVHR